MTNPLRRACGLLAGTLLLAAAGTAEAQNSRADRLLSDKPAPSRRACRIGALPRQLPTLAQLADSAQLTAAVAAYAQRFPVRDGKLFALYSITFDARGTPTQVRNVDYFLPEGQAETLATLVRTSLRSQPAGGFTMRLRVEPGGSPVFRMGWSESCAPASRMSFSLTAPAAAGVQGPPAPVRLRIFVDAEGRVGDTSVLSSSGSSELDRWVEEYVRSYQFAPGLVDGIPTAMDHEQTIRIRHPNGASGRSSRDN
jgi:TonB family protein